MKVAPLALLLVAPLITSCSSDDGSRKILVPFYALEYVAAQIAGDEFDIVSLAKPGQEPHDLELAISETAEVGNAALVVYERGFQSAVDEAVDTTEPEHTVDAAEVANLVTDESGAEDPHFWLDPRRLILVGDAIRDELVAIDPANKEAYDTNYAVLEADLTGVDGRMSVGLNECERRTVVVSHDAFRYLGNRYDLDVHAINGLSPNAEPSPAHIQELRTLIEEKGITTVFSEELVSPELAEALASDLDLQTAVLDPIEGLSDDTADDDYVSLMRRNLGVLREALGCA
ncbi:MAG TPA: metal ABC transporter substrate-binding protein [Nocardioidaceae bacterium]|nr:metal ABC transporter substrate-binding protein [Nocardioidaceae bacterium]